MRKRRSYYRSGFEDKVINDLKTKELPYKYESLKISYVKSHTYTPDLILPNGVVVELKGRFTSSDRSKHLEVKKQYPDIDLRFVFQDANKPLRKGSKTTYGMWATKNGFIWSQSTIPTEWWS